MMRFRGQSRRVKRLVPALAAAVLAIFTACASQPDANGPPLSDASSPDVFVDSGVADGGPADVGNGIYPIAIRLTNDLCLPLALPSGAGGTANCRVFVHASGGCNEPGLSPVPTADLAVINAKLQAQGQPPLQDTLCVLTQIADAGCVGDLGLGWCYVHGSCYADAGRMCKQDICTTTGVDGGAGGWLMCP